MVEERLDKGGMERSRTPFDTFSRETLGAGAEFPKRYLMRALFT